MTKKFVQRTHTTDKRLKSQIIERFGLSTETTNILISRGIDTIDAAERFLYPSLSDFNDPFLLQGMGAASDRIKEAVEQRETIVVYGDYDVDGLTSCALLTLCLSQIGATVVPYIPSRKNGYGLQKINLEYLAEEFCPDLIITTDCGVSAVEEVAFIQNELGIDVIVTDHHEPPEVLPDCILINPKADKNYPFRELSGAGVAFKVAQALVGNEDAKKFLDIAALGTLADCVPLNGENRVIAKLGLEAINTKKRTGIKVLCEALSLRGKMSACDIIMKLIPKLNAPGRLDDAQEVLEFFLSDDAAALKTQAERLLRDNSTRQLVTEEIVSDIFAEMSRECSFHRKSLIFFGAWRDGIAGIAAARLKESFYRPTILFVESKEGLLKGSGRSIQGVDMYKMLSALSDITEGFGGHSMACGVTLKKENFQVFKQRVEDYLQDIPKEAFEERIEYDCVYDPQTSQRLVQELSLFEPCLPDDKPVFFCEGGFSARPFKESSPHMRIFCGGLEVKAFYNFSDFAPVINNNFVKKQLLFNLSAEDSGKTEGILTDIKILSDFEDSDPLVKKLLCNEDTDNLQGISADREIFSLYYRHIKNMAKTANCFEDFYNMLYREDLSFRQFVACLIVFSELGLFKINLMPFFIRIADIKTDLKKSPFYQKLSQFTN